MKDFIALARAHGGQLSFGSSGTGTSPYLAMELFKSMTGVNIVHVPYKGTGAAVIDLMGGHVQTMFGSVSGTLPHVRSSKLRALGISSPQRWPTLPEIPTVAEAGVAGFEASTWYGTLAPAGTPPAVVNKLQSDFAAVLNAADVRKSLARSGLWRDRQHANGIRRGDPQRHGALGQAVERRSRRKQCVLLISRMGEAQLNLGTNLSVSKVANSVNDGLR